MKFTVVAIGRLSREYQPVFEHYAALLKPYLTLQAVEIPEVPLRQGRDQVLAREAEAILAKMRPGALTILLDREGKQLSSEEFSGFLADQKLHGRSEFQLVLGGAFGLHERVRAVADMRWSLSRLTFPHQLARCMAVEQLYRAVRIERGEPYHY